MWRSGRLRKLGFDVTGIGDTAAASATTVSYSGTAQADSASGLPAANPNPGSAP